MKIAHEVIRVPRSSNNTEVPMISKCDPLPYQKASRKCLVAALVDMFVVACVRDIRYPFQDLGSLGPCENVSGSTAARGNLVRAFAVPSRYCCMLSIRYPVRDVVVLY